MVEAIILIVVLAVTVGILWLAKRHGIVMRPEADGLEALPKELHEAELRNKRMSGIHLAIPVFSKGYRPKQGKVAP